MTGSGFGATQPDFDASSICSAIGADEGYLSWVDDSHAWTWAWSEPAGTRLPITVWRRGAPSSAMRTFGAPVARWSPR